MRQSRLARLKEKPRETTDGKTITGKIKVYGKAAFAGAIIDESGRLRLFGARDWIVDSIPKDGQAVEFELQASAVRRVRPKNR